MAILRELKLSDLQNFYYKSYFEFNDQPALMIQVDALSDMLPVSSATRPDRSFDWPLNVVPMGGDQVAAERRATLAVDVREAVRACAPALVVLSSFTQGRTRRKPNGDHDDSDLSVLEELGDINLPPIVEIMDVREFKHRVLFPTSQNAD